MKELLCGAVALCMGLTAQGQEAPLSAARFPRQKDADVMGHSQRAPAQEAQQPAEQQPQSEKNRSAIKVKPGAEAIKDKDLWEKTGYIHPFSRMPKYILQDQKAIWTSPLHTAKSDVKWWVIFGAATGALIATDKWTEKQFPNTSTQVQSGKRYVQHRRRIHADTDQRGLLLVWNR